MKFAANLNLKGHIFLLTLYLNLTFETAFNQTNDRCGHSRTSAHQYATGVGG